ncbi:hypothetical protein HDU67_002909, partial [Dinochytrium kinnereticum]
MGVLLSFKEITAWIVKSRLWMPSNTSAKLFEETSMLGPFLSRTACLSDSEGKVAETYFASSNAFAELDDGQDQDGFSLGARNLGDVKSAMTSLRNMIAIVQSSLHGLVMPIIKTSPDAREAVLNFISKAIELNYARGKMQVDRTQISTDGFMFNLYKLTLKLTDPVIDPNFSKIHLIDPRFFLTPTVRLPMISGTTMISADTEAFESCKSATAAILGGKTMNFVTDVFFLTLSAHHYGFLSICRFYGSFIKQISDLRKEINRLRAERDSGVWNTAPDRQLMGAPLLKRMQAQMDIVIAHKLLMDANLMDSTTIDQSLRFYNFAMIWLLRLATKGTGQFSAPDGQFWRTISLGSNQEHFLLPLPKKVDETYATLPEWIIDDVAEFFLFICRYKPTLLENAQRDEIITFSIVMLSSPAYVKNPHLRNKLVEVLFYFTLPLYRSQSGESVGPRLDLIFGTNEISKRHLVSSLIRYYIDVEHSGVSSAFYDKFNVRYNISQIL